MYHVTNTAQIEHNLLQQTHSVRTIRDTAAPNMILDHRIECRQRRMEEMVLKAMITLR